MAGHADQAEELRKACETRSELERAAAGLRCIAVGSGKGGVGKTMISVGLACCMAERDYRVLLVDADLGLANIDLQMGVEPALNLQDVIYGNCPLDRAVMRVQKGIDLLAASSGATEMMELGNARRQMVVTDLIRFAARYDFLVIDAAAGIGGNVISFLSASPEVLVVVANEPTSVMDAYSLIKVLRNEKPSPAIMLAVNMVRSLEEGKTLARRLNETANRYLGTELPLAGIVTYDEVVGDAIRLRTPVTRHAPGIAPVACLRELTRFIVDGRRLRSEHGARLPFFEQLVGVGRAPGAEREDDLP